MLHAPALGRRACRVQLQSGIAAEPYGLKSDRNVNVRARLGRFYINLLGPDIVRGLLGRPRLQSEFAGGDLLECKSPPANTNRRGAARVGNSQVHSGLAGVQVRSGLARLPTARSVLLVCGGLGFARVWGRLGCNSRLQMHSAGPPPKGRLGVGMARLQFQIANALCSLFPTNTPAPAAVAPRRHWR